MYYDDTWGNVPSGSRLEVDLKVSGAVGVAGTHALLGAAEPSTITSHSFPLSIPIQRGEQHRINFDVFSTGGTASVEVAARVMTPEGHLHGVLSGVKVNLPANTKALTVKFFVVGEP